MIRLGGLVSQKAFGKFEMGKVISNPFANAFAPTNEGEEAQTDDYEVSMAAKQLDDIIKSATELKAKMGEKEFNVAAWIQDHISKSQDYINQANYGFDKNESVNEAAVPTGERIQNLNNRIKALRDKISATKSTEQKKLFSDRLKNALQTLSNIKKDHSIKAPHRESIVKEESPCWKGYKQIGMKDKGGKQVPNCVPTESVVREAKGRGFATIQNDMAKVVDAIQSELEKYKSNKGTDKAKQNVENLKKLNVQKQRLEDELDGKVTSLYADYDLDQLHFMGRKK
jgi:hypothetical protein